MTVIPAKLTRWVIDRHKLDTERLGRSIPRVNVSAILLILSPSLAFLSLAGPAPILHGPSHDQNLESVAGIRISQSDNLRPGRPLRRQITGEASHSFKFSLKAGTATTIRVVQSGVDLKLLLSGPNGRKLFTADSPNGSFGSEEALVVAPSDGDYILELKPYQEDNSKGSYTISMAAPRLATSNDRSRYEAYVQLYRHTEASAVNEQGPYEEALKNYPGLAASFRRAADVRGQAQVYFNSAMAYHGLGTARSALADFEKALSLWRRLGDRGAAANTLSSMGYVATRLGERSRAITFFESARIIQIATGDRKGLADTLNNLGNLYKEQAKFDLAVDVLAKALSIHKEFGSTGPAAEIQASLGAAQADAGRLRKALELVEAALPVLSKLEDKFPYANAVITRGDVLFMLGGFKESTAAYEEALGIASQAGWRTMQARARNNIGRVEFLHGELAKARFNLEAALALAKEVGDKRLSSYIDANLGQLEVRERRINQAFANFYRSLSIFRERKDPIGEARLLNYIGLAYLADGTPDVAITHFTQALVVAENTGDAVVTGTTLANLMSAWLAKGDRVLAAALGKRAVNEYQSVRRGIVSMDERLQLSFIKSKESDYRQLAQLLIELGRIPEAERVISMLKVEEYSQFLRGSSAPASASNVRPSLAMSAVETALLNEHKKHVESVTAIAKEFGELQAESRKPEFEDNRFPKQARMDELERRLGEARAKFNAFMAQLRATTGQNDRRLTVSELKELLKFVGGRPTAIVSTIVGPDRLSLIVTTSDVQVSRTVNIGEREVNDLVAEFRYALRDAETDPRPAGKLLYDILVAPIENDIAGIEAETIVWSLDGTLRYIPPAALWDGKHYLAERFGNGVITFGGRTKLRDKVIERAKWGALAVGTSKSYESFPALPAVPDELDCVVTDGTTKNLSLTPICESGVITGRKYMDDTFTKESFKKAVGRYPFIHIASHFYLEPGDHARSYLLLGGGENRRFALDELSQSLFTGVELLTLSACNTGVDTAGSGTEVDGFGSLAQDEGAKAILATLWPVADPSTRDFMINFYDNYGRKGGVDKIESMRRAQLGLISGKASTAERAPTPERGPRPFAPSRKSPRKTFLKDPSAPYAHPFYWAPFVLIGNWR